MTTLLAVDDSNTMRRVLEITFEGENFETVLAGNAGEALAKLESHKPPIALIDVTLGTPDGYDLCEKVKSEFPDTKVMLLSSKQTPYDAGRGASVGADDHIDKPFETQALIDKVVALNERTTPATSLAKASSRRPTTAPPQALNDMEIEIPIELGTPDPGPGFTQPVPKPQAAETRKAPPPTRGIAPAPSAAPVHRAAPVAAVDMASTAISKPSPRAAAARSMASAAPKASLTLETKLADLGLNAEQAKAVLALSKEVLEEAVWEVVPTLAEVLIKEEISRLTKA